MYRKSTACHFGLFALFLTSYFPYYLFAANQPFHVRQSVTGDLTATARVATGDAFTRNMPSMLSGGKLAACSTRTVTLAYNQISEKNSSSSDPAGGPALPAGLDEEDTATPKLPEGLDDRGKTGPALPAGLGENEGAARTKTAGIRSTQQDGDLFFFKSLQDLHLNGFWDTRVGFRLQEDPHEKDASLGETRLQLDWQRKLHGAIWQVTADLLYDPIVDHSLDPERGYGWLDLRQVNAIFTPLDFMDVKVGRQILTWGTGDLIFINDLFPKDWQSFLSGRDVEYLKAPSDAVKVSIFNPAVNINLVYTPAFDSDRYVSGRRLSYFNRNLGRLAGRDAIIEAKEYSSWFQEDEWAIRLSRNFSAYEVAFYGYLGRWKSPAGYNFADEQYTHPKLAVWGSSIRGQALSGIGNLEFGFYDSREDRDGDNPFIPNSQFRFLAGYERDLPRIAHDFTVGLQYYLEYMMDHDSYRDTLPLQLATFADDEDRHVLTLRLTKMYMDQNLIFSLFTFYSPSDEDIYLRPRVTFKIDDNWIVEGGGNLFAGKEDYTFFGQFEKNTNAYVSLRYGF